jgi:HK97 gp10 family phage protein
VGSKNIKIVNPKFDLAKSECKKALQKGVLGVAQRIEGLAAANAPIDTGALRASIYSESALESNRDQRISEAEGNYPGPGRSRDDGRSPTTRDDQFSPATAIELNGELQAKVAVGARYGMHVELGTGKMSARPYLGPAAEQGMSEAKRIIETQLKKVLDQP